MTMTKGGSAKPPGSRPPASKPKTAAAAAAVAPSPALSGPGRVRRTHVPAAGTEHAAAVEKAQREMLHEGPSSASMPVDATALERAPRARIGADVVCEAILRQDVDVFFSYPGGVILPLYDVLGDHPRLRHILVRHEQGGAHAADGYARATGKVGVCMGTSGPRGPGPSRPTSRPPAAPARSTSTSRRTRSSRRRAPSTHPTWR